MRLEFAPSEHGYRPGYFMGFPKLDGDAPLAGSEAMGFDLGPGGSIRTRWHAHLGYSGPEMGKALDFIIRSTAVTRNSVARPRIWIY
jgi:hypothetical protein